MTNVVRLIPNTPISVIDENEITIERLASLLAAAVIDCIVDGDGDLYLNGEGVDFSKDFRIMNTQRLSGEVNRSK